MKDEYNSKMRQAILARCRRLRMNRNSSLTVADWTIWDDKLTAAIAQLEEIKK